MGILARRRALARVRRITTPVGQECPTYELQSLGSVHGTAPAADARWWWD